MPELIAFIGGGQMAGSLVGGLRAAGHPAARIRVAEPDPKRAEWLRDAFGVEVLNSGAEVAADANALVLAVKPQVMQDALHGVKPAAGAVVVSIAAGVRVASLRRWLGGPAAIVRCMPNTPAQLGSGVTALYAPPETGAEARALAEKILGSVGATCWVRDEALLDAVTALSGSGPAYFFLLTEVLRDAGQALGLDAATARLLAEKTFIGAGRMAEAGGKDVTELRANVTSKGGTTEAALAHLEKHGLRKLFADALKAAEQRGRELGAAFDR
jgi:pyrroline-5-carboxylate reductase